MTTHPWPHSFFTTALAKVPVPRFSWHFQSAPTPTLALEFQRNTSTHHMPHTFVPTLPIENSKLTSQNAIFCQNKLEHNTWTQPKLTGEGRVRVGHSMTPGDKSGEIWVLGGTMGASTVLDVQVLNIEALTWSTPLLDGAPPEARSRHSSNKHGDCIYIFGGGDNKKLFNDVWSLDFVAKLWTPVATTGTPPSPRWGHTATLVDSRLFIFGGHDGASRLNDVHVLDLQTLVWSQPDCHARPPPSPRSLTTPTPTSPTSSSISASTDEVEGQESGPNTPAPSPASQSNLAAPASPKDSSSTHARSSKPQSSESLSASSGENSRKESPVPPLSGTSSLSSSSSSLLVDAASAAAADSVDGVPPARAGHSANCLGRKLIIYGGGDGKLLGDLYYLNVDTFEWCVMESGNVPDRCAHTSEVIYAPGGSRMLVFGGSNGIKTFNDLYIVTYSKNRIRTTSQKRKSNSILKSSDSALKSPTSADSPTASSSPSGTSPTLSPSASTASMSTGNSTSNSPAQSHPSTHTVSQSSSTSYRDILQSSKETPKAATGNEKKAQENVAPITAAASGNDPLYRSLKEVGLEKCYSKFVEQEITLGQISILNDTHFQSLGITSIRDKALMAKLKENIQASSHSPSKSSFTTINGPKQAKVMKTTSEAAPTSPTVGRTYAQAASASSPSATPKSPANGKTSPGGTSELARKVQLSADALASAADSLRAAASKAIRTDQ